MRAGFPESLKTNGECGKLNQAKKVNTLVNAGTREDNGPYRLHQPTKVVVVNPFDPGRYSRLPAN